MENDMSYAVQYMDQYLFRHLEEFYQALPAHIKSETRLHEPLKNHTSFQIGGPADVLIEPASFDDIPVIIKLCAENNLKYMVIGNGTNLLFSDEGFGGVIIKLNKKLSQLSLLEGNRIQGSSGTLLKDLADFALEKCLSGLEFASGIPGTLGGAIYMNAGAYDEEMSAVVDYVRVLTKDGNIKALYNQDLEFGYRSSIIQKEGYIILDATFRLEPALPHLISNKMNNLNQRRRDKQPLELPSAGSVFKRPEGHFAGKLIMDSGLKGARVGDAAVSEKHCGFIVNLGNATAKDVLALIEYIIETVQSNFGLSLEPEIRLVER